MAHLRHSLQESFRVFFSSARTRFEELPIVGSVSNRLFLEKSCITVSSAMGRRSISIEKESTGVEAFLGRLCGRMS